MRSIRLHVQVLPWQKSSLSNGHPQNTRSEVILPWIEPCDEDISLQELSERIVSRFASIHRGKGVLNIECLQNYWGYVLDMPLTVGEVFDDISANTDISRSIVKVVRSPPTYDELENPLRSVSLAPESSARPQKRSLTDLAGPILHEQHRGGDAQGWGPDSLFGFDGRANKRRKLQNSISHTVTGSDRPIFSSESLQEGVHNSSRTFARRLSPKRQIVDSPRWSSKKQDNSYGTPASLSLNSPSRADWSKSYDTVAIPDSPLRRDASPANRNVIRPTKSDLHAPRSESPELGSTNNRSVFHGSGSTSTEQPRLGIQVPQGDVKLPLVTPEISKNGNDRPGDQPTLQEPSHTLSSLRDIVNPIDRDNQKSHELPSLSHIKQTESEKIATIMDKLAEFDRGKGDEKAIANMTKSTPMALDSERKQHRALVNQNKKAALQRTSRSDSRATAGTSKSTNDDILVEAKSKGTLPAEGGARQSHVDVENSNEMRPVVEAEKVGLEVEKLARDITPGERAMISKGANEKTKLPDKKVGNAKLVEESGTVRPTERRATRAAIAKGKVPELASVDTNAGTKMSENRSEATESLEAGPKEVSQPMHKTKLAKLAKGKTAVKAAKKTQVQDRSDKKEVERTREGEEKPLGESEESVSISQMKSPKNENPTAASHTVPILNPDNINDNSAKNKKLENTRMQLDMINESARNSGVPKTPKKPPLSDARRQSATMSLSTKIEPDRVRNSMTPPYPSSLVSKSRPKSSAPSNGTSLRKTLDSDTQPRSAAKQTSSVDRSSVSFAEDSTVVSSAQHGNGIVHSDIKESDRGTSAVTKVLKIENATEPPTEFPAPKKKLEVSKGPTTKDVKKETAQPKLKTQTKKDANQKETLKIQRDVKPEGRAIDPPIPPKSATQKEIIISSGSESSVSSFYSEDDLETRNAKPGPSKRSRGQSSKETARIKVEPVSVLDSVPGQKLTRAKDTKPSTRAVKTDCPEDNSPSTSVVTSTKETYSPRAKLQKPNRESFSTPVQIIDPQILSSVSPSERSSPRAPAQYMSKAESISSRTTSNASGSESDDSNSPPVETKQRLAKEDTRLVRSTPDGSQPSSSSSQARSVSSRSSESTRSSRSKHIERTAEQQLQRESRESKEPSKRLRHKKAAKSHVLDSTPRNSKSSDANKKASESHIIDLTPRKSKSAANKKASKSPVLDETPRNSDFPRMTDLKKQSALNVSGSGHQRSSYPLPSGPNVSKRASISPFHVPSSSNSSSDGDSDK